MATGYRELRRYLKDNDGPGCEGLSHSSRSHEILLIAADYWREHPSTTKEPQEDDNAQETKMKPETQIVKPQQKNWGDGKKGCHGKIPSVD